MENKTIFITVDFEEWFHITYLDKYHFNKSEIDTFADKILFFFEKLTELNIHSTVFVVGEIIERNIDILKKIKELGHEIGCHGYSHKILTSLSDDDFLNETKKAKEIIETKLNTQVYGYRAPSFSLNESKLNILEKLGFKYDSSYISFKENEFSQILDLSSFIKVSNNIYKRGSFYEFEMPYAKFFGIKKALGGGHFRLYPYWLFKNRVNNYLKQNDSLVFFIHPYEISGANFSKSKYLSLKDCIRLNLNRKNAKKKLLKFIQFAKDKGYTFSTLQNYIKR